MLVVLLASLPFLFLLARRPVLRRLAVRNAARRPRETLLVILGSMLGTAIITGSFVVGDTLAGSIRSIAVTGLGPVDELISVPDRDTAGELEQRLASGLSPSEADGVLGFGTAAAAVEADGRAEPNARVVELDFDRARTFGSDPGATGIAGPTPAPGEVVLGRDLASLLDAEDGDRVTLYAYGQQVELTVARVLPRVGLAGLLDPEAFFMMRGRTRNLFVGPGTLDRLHRADAERQAAPPQRWIAVSNPGGVFGGIGATDATVAAIAREVGPALPVREVKREIVTRADEQGRQFTQLFVSIGFFSVLAGVLLLVNIFVALAQERKVSLGMLRAVGLRRASLVGSFSLEGWVYALLSSTVGVLAGIGVGRVIVMVASGVFAERGDVALDFRFEASSLQSGFSIGFLISLATVVVASVGLARMNVIRAIRDLPEPPPSRRRRLAGRLAGASMVAFGALLTAAGISNRSAAAALLGPPLLLGGLVLARPARVGSRLAVTVAALLVLTWEVFAFDLVPEAFEGGGIPVFVIQGVTLVAAAVALLDANMSMLKRLAGEGRLTLRLGLAYPLARRFRTGAILAMFAMVVFTLTFITVFGEVVNRQVDRFTRDTAGGFQVRVQSNPGDPVPVDRLRAMPEVRAVAPIAVVAAEWQLPALGPGFQGWPLGGVEETLVRVGPPGLAELMPGLADEAAAWQRLLDDPGSVIVNEFFLQMAAGPPSSLVRPGDTVTVRDPSSGRSKTLRIVALADSGFASGFAMAYTSQGAVAEVFGSRAVPALAYVATRPGTDDAALAARIAAENLSHGAEAQAFRVIVEDGLSQQLGFFRLMQGYLSLGLIVGIAGLGVVMVRAVRERRRQIGVLRSLGFPAHSVRRAFLVESGFVAMLGVACGSALALVCAWRLLDSGAFGGGLPLTIPWTGLAVLVALNLGAALLATLAPAQQASRIRPAVALRIAD